MDENEDTAVIVLNGQLVFLDDEIIELENSGASDESGWAPLATIDRSSASLAGNGGCARLRPKS